MLAHELRNPLAPISAAAELLRRGQINAARRHMTSRVELQTAPVEIRHIVEDAIEQVSPLITSRHQQLSAHLSVEL